MVFRNVQGEMMIVSREVFEVATESAGRRDWVRPALHRIDAGSAEQGAPNGNPDIGVSFS